MAKPPPGVSVRVGRQSWSYCCVVGKALRSRFSVGAAQTASHSAVVLWRVSLAM